MRFLSAAIALAQIALAQGITAEQAAKSPYDFARYIESHPGADVTPVWKSMGVADGPGQVARCEPSPGVGPCEIEIITLLDPSQVILLLEGRGWDDYLRFLQDGQRWRFAGAARAFLKNFPRRHEILRIGDKPFLVVSEQGISGTGVDSEGQTWYDLTAPDLAPVFSFTVQGEEFGSLIRRSIRGNANGGRAGGVDSISLTVRVDFDLQGRHLSSLQYVALYQRAPGGREFSLKSVGSGGEPVSIKEFEAVSDIHDDPLPFEQVLIYALPGLKQIASGSDAEARGELREYLAVCKDTPEKKTLLDLLGRR